MSANGEKFDAIYTAVFHDGDDVANEDAKFLIRLLFKTQGITERTGVWKDYGSKRASHFPDKKGD